MGDVIEWADQSGNGNDLAMVGVTGPVLAAYVQNGQDAVSSYGRLIELQTVAALPDLHSGGTVMMVAKQSNVNGATASDVNGVFIGASGLASMEIRRGGSVGGTLYSIRGGITAATFATSPEVVPDNTFVTITLVNDGANNGISINGGTVNSQAASNPGYTANSLTMFNDLSGVLGNKMIAFCVIYTRTLSGPEIAQNELYFKTRYNHY